MCIYKTVFILDNKPDLQIIANVNTNPKDYTFYIFSCEVFDLWSMIKESQLCTNVNENVIAR